MDNENIKIPLHVGLIMDGNGRWAKGKGLSRSKGHKAGVEQMQKLCAHAQSIGVKYLTVYALSTENLFRPKQELDGLYALIKTYFNSLCKKNTGVKIKIIGDISPLPKEVQKNLEEAEKLSPKNAEFTMVFAINYGGRAEILRAVNRAVEQGKALTEAEFSALLYTDGIPYPDLIIRTGKEKRLSNFLCWQSAYAELYFTDTLFPDFDEGEFDKAIADYAKRERRFGKI
ncbi:MAG: di-trans,poly-cis-decaprenylcistransferase [Clostridiales bacterium]|nr:di-trans,poly-cis-decaprenylcistransferase [Clostridiales bacterium]